MRRKTLEYQALNGYTHCVMVDNISFIEKLDDTADSDTVIVTRQGVRLITTDSIKTLDARINSES